MRGFTAPTGPPISVPAAMAPRTAVRGLFTGLSLIAQGVQAGQANLTPYNTALSGVRNVLQAAVHGHPAPLSWQALLASGTSPRPRR